MVSVLFTCKRDKFLPGLSCIVQPDFLGIVLFKSKSLGSLVCGFVVVRFGCSGHAALASSSSTFLYGGKNHILRSLRELICACQMSSPSLFMLNRLVLLRLRSG